MIDSIKEIIGIPWVRNLTLTITVLIIIAVLFYILLRVMKKTNINMKIQKRTRKWTFYVLIFFYGLILIRIWAFADLFVYLKNPMISKFFYSLLAIGLIYILLSFLCVVSLIR